MKKILILMLAVLWMVPGVAARKKQTDQPVQTDREYWAAQAYRMARPVLSNLAAGTLHEKMPIDQFDNSGRAMYAHLEAVGRLLCGLAPWFEVSGDSIPAAEAALRDELLGWAHAGLRHAVDPDSPDYLNFRKGYGQALVDAAFLAQGFLRSPRQLWDGLDTLTQRRVITEMKATRRFLPMYGNWLMFSATVEAFLRMAGEPLDLMRTDYAFRQLDDWYIGDGLYSDGPKYHNDYYNSFVMQPMLVDAGRIMNRYYKSEAPYSDAQYGRICRRASRYAGVLERSISPEGTFPVVGRSILYRTGCMHSLAQASLLKMLPGDVTEGQVRAALTTVMRRMLEAPGTYDEGGWLTMGFCGSQKEAGETYLCTGSMYLASTIFLPLGLPAEDSFWTAPAQPWTTQKAWGGMPFPRDHAIAD
ncbi:DUF2264 domain-containing protein [Millionella massiliensis]|uniref:DUF2264 domain-containing protein n=1 Tax=Millionella massiliensis TaxID=1871023 RepID=UPI0008DA745E|nr:DUF2264 domain-containing protein [Millionella massiliensis]